MDWLYKIRPVLSYCSAVLYWHYFSLLILLSENCILKIHVSLPNYSSIGILP